MGASSINGALPVLYRHRGAIIVYKASRLAKTRALSPTHTHTFIPRIIFVRPFRYEQYKYVYVPIYIYIP